MSMAVKPQLHMYSTREIVYVNNIQSRHALTHTQTHTQYKQAADFCQVTVVVVQNCC